MENRLKIAIGSVMVVALATAATWYLWQADRQTVLSTESQSRQEQLEALLAGNGIDFGHDELHRVTVSSEDVQLARALADQASLTQPERSGFEIFEDEDYGATEFVQRINYQRALQAELERTIIRIAGIRNARVHILQPARSTFFRRDNKSRASVVLELESGAKLASVAPSVAEIMLGAIDGLEIEDIKIISGHGGVITASAADGEPGFVTQSVSELAEQKLTNTIYAVLDPLFDRSAVGVSVSVEMDRSSRNVRRENVPATVVRSTSEDDSGTPVAVPGGGVVTEEVRVPPGTIERIGVGVMLPNPIEESSIAEIEQLLRSGLGLSEARGDSLTVMAYQPSLPAATGVANASQALPESTAAVSRAREAGTGTYTQGQLTAVFAVMLLALVVLLAGQRISQGRQRQRIVHQVSSWIREPVHE